MTSAFQGFGPQALAFFKALAFHQDRAWFQENKVLYEAEIREPMVALVETLTQRFAKARIPLRGGRKTLFRINRDVRFARDKRPYQTHCGAVLTSNGGKDGAGLIYIHIAPPGVETMDGAMEGSFVAAGFHLPDPGTLAAIRAAIRERPGAWRKVEAELADAGLSVSGHGQMKRLPRGFEDMKESPVESAIRRKSFIVEEPIPEAEVFRPELTDRIVAFTRRARPLLDFGWKAIG